MSKFSILALGALFLTTFAAADEPAPKKQTKEKSRAESATKADEEEVLTFTTDDLERKYGPSSKPVVKTTPPAAEAPGPLEQLQASQKANRDRAAQRVEADKRVEATRARVKELEQRIARLRNPLLGRAEPEAEEQDAWSQADQAGRVKIAEDALAAARKELQEAVKESNELR